MQVPETIILPKIYGFKIRFKSSLCIPKPSFQVLLLGMLVFSLTNWFNFPLLQVCSIQCI